MHPSVSRRRFLHRTTAGTAVAWAGAWIGGAWRPPRVLSAAPDPLTADPAGLTTYQTGPQIWVRWNNQPVTCYRAHRSQKYPYLYPLSGPVTGLSLTTETALPYPHHCSLFFACDRVNGANYWQEGFERGQILSQGPRVGTRTADAVEILDTTEWQLPNGPGMMRDERRITIRIAGPQLRLVDWDLRWQAVQAITVEKNNHSLFALRAAGELTPAGGGTLRNAEGDRGEKATFGKPSAWCAFFGRRAGQANGAVEGIAIFDHPGNPWFPSPWFTRDYGFLSPSPFNFISAPWKLAAGDSVRLRYRVVLFGGTPDDAGLARLHQEWAA